MSFLGQASLMHKSLRKGRFQVTQARLRLPGPMGPHEGGQLSGTLRELGVCREHGLHETLSSQAS